MAGHVATVMAGNRSKNLLNGTLLHHDGWLRDRNSATRLTKTAMESTAILNSPQPATRVVATRCCESSLFRIW